MFPHQIFDYFRRKDWFIDFIFCKQKRKDETKITGSFAISIGVWSAVIQW